jgi:hypothetical protein
MRAPPGGREQDAPGGQLLERIDHPRAQRDAAARALGVRVGLQAAFGDRAADREEWRQQVDVRPLASFDDVRRARDSPQQHTR